MDGKPIGSYKDDRRAIHTLAQFADTVIEQQALFAENQVKAEARITRNENAIAALLTIAEAHEREIAATGEQMAANSKQMVVYGEQTKSLFAEIIEIIKVQSAKTAETDERLNALINVVERIISKNQ